MNSSMVTLILLVGACSIVGQAKSLAVPLNEAEITELDPSSEGVESSVARITRRAEDSIPAASAQNHAEEVEPAARIERAPINILHYVDFGGHTGENGAFGWYADFPAHQ